MLDCSDLLEGMKGSAVARTWHHRMVPFAEDLVRKRQRPHRRVMSVDVYGSLVDFVHFQGQ